MTFWAKGLLTVLLVGSSGGLVAGGYVLNRSNNSLSDNSNNVDSRSGETSGIAGTTQTSPDISTGSTTTTNSEGQSGVGRENIIDSERSSKENLFPFLNSNTSPENKPLPDIWNPLW